MRKMLKKTVVTAVLASTVIGLTGCGTSGVFSGTLSGKTGSGTAGFAAECATEHT